MVLQFIGLTERDGRLNFEYKVTMGKESTSFYAGIGLVKAKREEGTAIFHIPSEYRHEFAKALKPFGRLVMDDIKDVVYRIIPPLSEVAECLLSDIEAGNQSFNDFCDNYGYSSDSIKAFDTYRACMDMAKKFKRSDLVALLTPEQKEQLGIEE